MAAQDQLGTPVVFVSLSLSFYHSSPLLKSSFQRPYIYVWPVCLWIRFAIPEIAGKMSLALVKLFSEYCNTILYQRVNPQFVAKGSLLIYSKARFTSDCGRNSFVVIGLAVFVESDVLSRWWFDWHSQIILAFQK